MAAKLLYNVRAYEDTAAHLATDTTIYPANALIIASDTGVVKKGNGTDVYADLDDIGALQVATWGDITGNRPLSRPRLERQQQRQQQGIIITPLWKMQQADWQQHQTFRSWRLL